MSGGGSQRRGLKRKLSRLRERRDGDWTRLWWLADGVEVEALSHEFTTKMCVFFMFIF